MEENRFPTKLLTVLILSLTFNVVFIATQILKAWEKKELMTTIQLIDPVIDARKDRGVGGEVLKQFFSMSNEQLQQELSKSQHVESGFLRRDLALGLLTQFHYFPLDRVLVQGALQKREIFFENEGGERIKVVLFAGLGDADFFLVKKFLDLELWPLSVEGLINECKRLGDKAPDSLKKALFSTPEFQRLQRIFEASKVVMEPENILSILLLSDEVDLKSLRSVKTLLRPLLERRSKNVASLYFWIEPDLFSLEDAQVLELLDLVEKHQPWVVEGVKKLIDSPRSDPVRLKAARFFENRSVVEQVVAEEKKRIFHRVEPKETLWQIARRYGVSVEEIAEINHIGTGQVLSVGRELEIPSSSTRSTPPG
jgi:hypothetical protein